MVFSSPIFLFLFLPFVVTFYLLIPKSAKNFYLLVVSLIFYFWAELSFGWVMVLSMLGNYLFVRLIDYFNSLDKKKIKKTIFIIGLLFNLGLLIYFKYANFLVRELSILGMVIGLPMFSIETIPLAVGISFYTFHAISYLVDVYKGVTIQKSIITSSLYIAFFPQLIAGPIVRYHTIARELVQRTVTAQLFAEGVERFILGLGKKVLLANNFGLIADGVFAANPVQLEMGLAWLGIVCYMLQIYFDFSGYSDMAIGLARMFGFHFPENFNYPYIAQSVTEFWRRWHISLSSWFRDYVYIPLGGNRKGEYRTYFNLFLVFLLCGFWHGASWNFIFWGIWYGVFLIIERWKGLSLLQYLWRPYRHLYLLLVVMIGWVFFRSPDFSFAISYLKAMIGLSESIVTIPVIFDINNRLLTTLAAGIILCMPVNQLKNRLANFQPVKLQPALRFSYVCLLFFIFSLSAMVLAVQTYNPFIYFRF